MRAIDLDQVDPELRAAFCHVRRFQPGQYAFYQGEPCTGLYALRSGVVAVEKADEDGGTPLLVRLLTPGSYVGYRAFFSGSVYRASSVALQPSELVFARREDLVALMHKHPLVLLGFLDRLARDLEQAESDRLDQFSHSSEVRLARLLVRCKDFFGEVNADGQIELDLPFSRRDIAALLATRPETVTRSIKKLSDAGAAKFSRRRVVVDDLDLLLDAARVS